MSLLIKVQCISLDSLAPLALLASLLVISRLTLNLNMSTSIGQNGLDNFIREKFHWKMKSYTFSYIKYD